MPVTSVSTSRPLVAEVVAYDLSHQMLDVVGSRRHRARLEQYRHRARRCAERLPFADASFDFVFSRYSAHHWSDLGLALREVRRVLKPGGVAAFVDVMSPGSPLLDTYLQSVEVLRDTSHVRDYSAGRVAATGQRSRPVHPQPHAPAPAPGVHLVGRAHAHPERCVWPFANCSKRWATKFGSITR